MTDGADSTPSHTLPAAQDGRRDVAGDAEKRTAADAQGTAGCGEERPMQGSQAKAVLLTETGWELLGCGESMRGGDDAQGASER